MQTTISTTINHFKNKTMKNYHAHAMMMDNHIITTDQIKRNLAKEIIKNLPIEEIDRLFKYRRENISENIVNHCLSYEIK